MKYKWGQKFKDIWLGSNDSAVNQQRFWAYLGFLFFALCLICLAKELHS